MNATADDFLRRRRAAVARHASQIGLDFLSVLPDTDDPSRYRLELHFLPGDPGKQAAPAGLQADNFHFTAGDIAADSLFTLEILETVGTTVPLRVRFDETSDLARQLGRSTVFTFELVDVLHLDPFFARLDFSLDPEVPRAEDCPEERTPAAAPELPLANDYLAKDFASFRQKMLDHLAQRLPGWTERSPADLLVTLVELLADAGDRASYYQDAVATEAYLGTARLRTSVRRHARLAGYRVHEGAGARVWAHLTAAAPAMLPAGTLLLTRVPGFDVLLSPDTLAQALRFNPEVFETLEDLPLRPEHNEIPIYSWGAEEFGLPQGATSATLQGHFPDLAAGDVLVLEQVLDETTGLAADPGRSLRQAVRLTRVSFGIDPITPISSISGLGTPVDLTEIEWHPEDALPAPLPLAARIGGAVSAGLAVARGNVVLADYGRRVPAEELTVPSGRFQPRLGFQGLTWQMPWDAAAARGRSAASALDLDPRQAVPAIRLSEPGRTWAARRDLLDSGRSDDDFVVEMEEDGTATLRFGDGALGRPPAPGSGLTASYRVGNGAVGNIGRDSLAHLASDVLSVAAVRNPLAAAGGTDPEPLDGVRLAAPGFIDTLESRSTLEDFVARVEADAETEVERAVASLRWTGSWYTLELAVQRKGRLPVDAAFVSRLRALLEDSRVAGWELAILPLSAVGLDIALTILLAPGVSRGRAEQALLDTFSHRDLPDGRRGFFHPANLGPGEPVYLSRIVEAALAVPGVRAVDFGATPARFHRFRRFGEPSHGEIEAGRIRLRRGELPRVDNDPAAPENGRIQFFMEGGR